jgi:uncharacterized membrane protein
MSKYIVVTFPNQAKAYEAVSTFNALHMEGSISVYGTIVVKREADGTLTTQQREPEEAIGAGLGALLGALVGVFAGPAGVAVGMAAGSMTGAVGGVVHADVSDEFLEDVTKQMMPGTYAVLAEVSETWTAPIDTRMEALGGKVLREYRGDVIDDILEKRAEERHARLADWKAKRAGSKAEHMETDVELEAMDVLDKLQRTAAKARRRLDDAKQELDEKLKKLEEQASKAKPDVKKDIDERIAELRHDFEARERKLYHALDVAQEALA